MTRVPRHASHSLGDLTAEETGRVEGPVLSDPEHSLERQRDAHHAREQALVPQDNHAVLEQASSGGEGNRWIMDCSPSGIRQTSVSDPSLAKQVRPPARHMAWCIMAATPDRRSSRWGLHRWTDSCQLKRISAGNHGAKYAPASLLLNKTHPPHANIFPIPNEHDQMRASLRPCFPKYFGYRTRSNVQTPPCPTTNLPHHFVWQRRAKQEVRWLKDQENSPFPEIHILSGPSTLSSVFLSSREMK